MLWTEPKKARRTEDAGLCFERLKVQDLNQVFDGLTLVFELLHSGVDFSAAEFVDLDALDDFDLATVGTHREGRNQAWCSTVAAVGADAHADAVASRSRCDDLANRVNDAVGCRCSR
jgi:hypothetical protein